MTPKITRPRNSVLATFPRDTGWRSTISIIRRPDGTSAIGIRTTHIQHSGGSGVTVSKEMFDTLLEAIDIIDSESDSEEAAETAGAADPQ